MPDLLTLAEAAPTAAAAAVSTWPGLLALIAVILAPHIATIATLVQGRRTKALAAQAADDAAQTREQTVNEHENHPTPNLRGQLDAQDDRMQRIEDLVTGVADTLSNHIEQADAWQTAVDVELTRRRRPLLSWRS